nr:hypothetical protein [Tanacetum cinerariifolium]
MAKDQGGLSQMFYDDFHTVCFLAFFHRRNPRGFQPSGGYHVVPPLYTGTFMPPKPNLVFNTAPTAVETDHLAFNVQLSLVSHTTIPTTHIIEDWVFDSEDESKTKAPQIVLSFIQSSEQVKSPRHSIHLVKTFIPAATPKPTSLNFDSSCKRRNLKACFICKSVDHLIKNCDYHAKKMAQPTSRNYTHRGNHKQYASLTHTSSLYDRFQPSGGYHAVPPLYTGTFMPPKPNLVFNTAPTTIETDHLAFNVQLSPVSHTTIPTAHIIQDWVSDSEDESKTKAPQIVLSFIQSSEQVKSPRHSIHLVKTFIPAATPKPTSLNFDSSCKRRNLKACFICKSVDHLIKNCDYHAKKIAQPTSRNYTHRGNHKQYASLTHTNPQKHMVPPAILTQTKLGNPQHALKDKGVIDSGCSRHMTGNMS